MTLIKIQLILKAFHLTLEVFYAATFHMAVLKSKRVLRQKKKKKPKVRITTTWDEN